MAKIREKRQNAVKILWYDTGCTPDHKSETPVTIKAWKQSNMSNKPYFPYGINLISKFLGAVVDRGWRLKEGCACCRRRELNHNKF